jgi:twitching motility protein PilT
LPPGEHVGGVARQPDELSIIMPDQELPKTGAEDGVCAWRIQDLTEIMVERGASDVLLTAGTPPQLRVNGVLRPLGERLLTPEETRHVARELLAEEQYQQLLQKRSLDLSTGFGGLARIRANVFFQRGSVALAIRLIPSHVPPFDELGLPGIVRDFASAPNGLVLITGPAGSGKSTTMAAMVDFINESRHVHIVCIEDPIEYMHHHRKSVVDQREIGQDALSFQDALRTVFRQSPDIIMVGEMRDLESIDLALTLAETGHLILGTLHTHDTTNAVGRIAGVYPASHQQQVHAQLSMILVGVISQALLPSIDGKRMVLACEVLTANNAVRNLIREQQAQQLYSAIQTGKDDGMITLNESLMNLCDRGLISREAAMARSSRRKELGGMLSFRTKDRGS